MGDKKKTNLIFIEPVKPSWTAIMTGNSKHTHAFVESYDGFIGFGWDRKTDENSLVCYLQMFSDDTLLKVLVPRLSDQDMDEIQTMILRMLKKHLTETEYHQFFLKDRHP
jgi:hypothetical protein